MPQMWFDINYLISFSVLRVKNNLQSMLQNMDSLIISNWQYVSKVYGNYT